MQKSQKQVGYLLSNDSPLTSAQQSKLKGELHSGAVTVKKKKPKKSSLSTDFRGKNGVQPNNKIMKAMTNGF